MNTNEMRVTTYGTRGSIPVAGEEYREFGGNTTCLRIESPCLPEDMALVVDAGSGYRRCSADIFRQGIKKVCLLQTHYHWDHTHGLPFGAHTYAPGCFTYIWGPREHGIGPKEVHTLQMKEPVFPVNFAKVADRFRFHALEQIGTQVLLFHSDGGVKIEKVPVFRSNEKNGTQVHFGKNPFGKTPGAYPVNQCLVVWMYKTEHPEYTVSYRFEDRRLGKVFVFLTDHEVTAGWAGDLLAHLKGADFLIQDGQYNHEAYETRFVGWGHGTPVYCARTAVRAGVHRLGITHHDHNASDKDVRAREDEAYAELIKLGTVSLAGTVFACKDYGTIIV